MAKLIITDSLFNVFESLKQNIENVNELSQNNIIFCEEKMTLMVERYICEFNGGSFNTKVYSFAKFLAQNKTFDNVLSKVGSAMAIKNVLMNLNLKRLRGNSFGLAPTLSELIAQLKSAGINGDNLNYASQNSQGILSDKLFDIANVYNEYDKFLAEKNLLDQNTAYSYLPQVIENSTQIKNADVYIVGFTSLTFQAKKVISSIIKRAKSVTAIMVGGQNKFAFVNETAQNFRDICAFCGEHLTEQTIHSPYNENAKVIMENLFCPNASKKEKIKADNIFVDSFGSIYEETNRVGEVIKAKVLNEGYRYKDFVIATLDSEEYKDAIAESFSRLEIPYYLDEKKVALSHPFVRLIIDYIDAYRKNFERESLKSFYKNPLLNDDKDFLDDFDNYTLKYNVNYDRIKIPFTLFDGKTETKETVDKLNEFREYVCSCFEKFNVLQMIEKLNVKEKLEGYSSKLLEVGFNEESAINSQIYNAITNVLDEISQILPISKLSISEYKSIFISGVQALKLSILPQYNDAVFVGDYKECALSQPKILFAVGLTSGVPSVKEDVALLSDSDINTLENIKVLIEPKIRIVNHRTRESVTLCLSAFKESLYLSYPVSGFDGKVKLKSEILAFILGKFKVNEFPPVNGYLTNTQGLYSFSKECGEFCDENGKDNTKASSFYQIDKTQKSRDIVKRANKELKVRLDENRSILVKSVNSPTGIEEYYKCPYSAFIKLGLKVRERELGKVDGSFVGTLMHEILKEYVKNVDKVFNQESSNEVFEKAKAFVINKPKFISIVQDEETSFAFNNALEECKKYCYKTYKTYAISSFKCEKGDVEARFGKNGKYPPIELLDGKVQLSGSVDRIDKCGEYYRIIDYKTGGYENSPSKLFMGLRLQLYLYSAVIKDKILAGAYYVPIENVYAKEENKSKYYTDGKTLKDVEVMKLQDTTFEENGQSEFFSPTISGDKIKGATDGETLSAMVNYSLRVSELATEQMREGVIVPSPSKDACVYCQFSAICGKVENNARKVKKITDKFFVDAIKEGVSPKCQN